MGTGTLVRYADSGNWVQTFMHGYHTEHRHSGLKFVTPNPRHRGKDIDLLAQRYARYQAAKAQHPERRSGVKRNGQPDTTVFLNPGKPIKAEHQNQARAA